MGMSRPAGMTKDGLGIIGQPSSFFNALQRRQTIMQSREEACEIRLTKRAFIVCWMFVIFVHAALGLLLLLRAPASVSADR